MNHKNQNQAFFMPSPEEIRQEERRSYWLSWILTVLISLLILILANRLVSRDLPIFQAPLPTERARVLQLLNREEKESIGGHINTIITVEIELLSGEQKGQKVELLQEINPIYVGATYTKELEKGDLIMAFASQQGEENVWRFQEYYRMNQIYYLGLVFALLLLILGHWQGFNTLLSLVFTFAFVFFVFVPSILQGLNIYFFAFITAIYVIVVTLLLVHGYSRKTFATMLSCMGGVLIALLLILIMKSSLGLTGVDDEEAMYLLKLHPERPIDMTAIVYSSIIIGAMGAIMDVAMDISASLFEIAQHVPNISPLNLMKSGFRIGRDIMGTMANTLVLAYIGSSLAGTLLYLTYSNTLDHLLNRETVIIELLQALIGSSAMILTIPLSSVISAYFFCNRGKSQRHLI